MAAIQQPGGGMMLSRSDSTATGRRTGSVRRTTGPGTIPTSRPNGPAPPPHHLPSAPATTASQTGSTSTSQTAGLNTAEAPLNGLSGLVCNAYTTTGREPRPLVGATTTIVGDRLYVFGGRKLSRTRPQLTADMYELDLGRRHWRLLDCGGDIPSPRYFHSMCAVGDSKMVCYGGMAPASAADGEVADLVTTGEGIAPGEAVSGEVAVMSDVHIFDIPTRSWTRIATAESPQGRYAHCAVVLPSSAPFASDRAPLAAIRQAAAGGGSVSVDGTGGAELVVVGGQDGANRYIEQISIFNLRSLRWTSTQSMSKGCGAYRSVVCALDGDVAAQICRERHKPSSPYHGPGQGKSVVDERTSGGAALVYSNYNFLAVELDLQIRLPDGTMVECTLPDTFTPPGLRFPNGGIVAGHFVVSGTFLTSSKQEYALWALNLRTLQWSRVDAGGVLFSHASWNRGLVWSRRNAYVLLGHRKRRLVEDYNHRRLNFANLCIVELEAYGLFDNPRDRCPTSEFVSASGGPLRAGFLSTAGGRPLTLDGGKLGSAMMGMRALADMEIVGVDGERVPANSRVLSRRWGPLFNALMKQAAQEDDIAVRDGAIDDDSTVRPATFVRGHRSKPSAATTVTPSVRTAIRDGDGAAHAGAKGPPSRSPPVRRPRNLFLPHTKPTILALVHFLYTSSLPPPSSCSSHVLCSLLLIARPYKVDGLLEAVVSRLHTALNSQNTALVFNAAALATGGGDGVAFALPPLDLNPEDDKDDTTAVLLSTTAHKTNVTAPTNGPMSGGTGVDDSIADMSGELVPLTFAASATLGTALDRMTIGRRPTNRDDDSSTSSSASPATTAAAPALGEPAPNRRDDEVWTGAFSAVVGLQKRGLRGLMEGRKARNRGGSSPKSSSLAPLVLNTNTAPGGAASGLNGGLMSKTVPYNPGQFALLSSAGTPGFGSFANVFANQGMPPPPPPPNGSNGPTMAPPPPPPPVQVQMQLQQQQQHLSLGHAHGLGPPHNHGHGHPQSLGHNLGHGHGHLGNPVGLGVASAGPSAPTSSSTTPNMAAAKLVGGPVPIPGSAQAGVQQGQPALSVSVPLGSGLYSQPMLHAHQIGMGGSSPNSLARTMPHLPPPPPLPPPPHLHSHPHQPSLPNLPSLPGQHQQQQQPQPMSMSVPAQHTTFPHHQHHHLPHHLHHPVQTYQPQPNGSLQSDGHGMGQMIQQNPSSSLSLSLQTQHLHQQQQLRHQHQDSTGPSPGINMGLSSNPLQSIQMQQYAFSNQGAPPPPPQSHSQSSQHGLQMSSTVTGSNGFTGATNSTGIGGGSSIQSGANGPNGNWSRDR